MIDKQEEFFCNRFGGRCTVQCNDCMDENKRQKRAIIEIMRADEINGLYDE